MQEWESPPTDWNAWAQRNGEAPGMCVLWPYDHDLAYALHLSPERGLVARECWVVTQRYVVCGWVGSRLKTKRSMNREPQPSVTRNAGNSCVHVRQFCSDFGGREILVRNVGSAVKSSSESRRGVQGAVFR